MLVSGWDPAPPLGRYIPPCAPYSSGSFTGRSPSSCRCRRCGTQLVVHGDILSGHCTDRACGRVAVCGHGFTKDGLYPYQRTQLRPEVPASITMQMMAPLSDVRLTCEVCQFRAILPGATRCRLTYDPLQSAATLSGHMSWVTSMAAVDARHFISTGRDMRVKVLGCVHETATRWRG